MKRSIIIAVVSLVALVLAASASAKSSTTMCSVYKGWRPQVSNLMITAPTKIHYTRLVNRCTVADTVAAETADAFNGPVHVGVGGRWGWNGRTWHLYRDYNGFVTARQGHLEVSYFDYTG